MRIGITYDLRDDYIAAGFSEEETVEFDCQETIQAIEKALDDLGYQTDRIGNIKHLTKLLAKGDRWDMVFNIAEGLIGFSREAQVPALLDAYNIPYPFSDPLVLCLTLHKAMAKRIVQQLGIPTPDFFVAEEITDLKTVNLPFPLFVKPVAEGTSKGITEASKITNRNDLISMCTRSLLKYKQPVLIETFLPGREFTVGILGTGKNAQAIGVIEVIMREAADPGIYSYRNKEQYEKLVEYRMASDSLAKKSVDIALAVWQGIGCRDAGRVDIRVDADGMPNFMEVNPLAGLHPQRSDLCIIARMAGMSYISLIEKIMLSAISRVCKEEHNSEFTVCLGR